MALTCKSELLALQLDEVQAAWALERTLLQTMAGRHEGVTAEAKSEVERLKFNPYVDEPQAWTKAISLDDMQLDLFP